MFCLLFDSEHRCLGEVVTERGALRRCTLTSDGEGTLGAEVERWQTSGIAVRKPVSDAFYLERVQPRAPGFQDALVQWGYAHGISVVPLPDVLIPHWESIVRLPLEPVEQFAFLIALKHTPTDLLPEWRAHLHEAQLLVEHERRSAKDATDILRKRLAAHLERPFVKGKKTNGRKAVAKP